MRSSSVPRLVLALAVATLSACSGGGGAPPGGGSGGGGGGTTAPTLTYTIPGPYGATYTPNGGTAFTVSQVRLSYLGYPGQPAGQLYEYLQVDMTFTQDITNALPAPGKSLTSGTQLGVEMALDVDDNAQTGNSGVGCGTNAKTGAEYLVDSGSFKMRQSDGSYVLVATNNNYSGAYSTVSASVSGNTLTEKISLSDLATYTTVPKIGLTLLAINGADLSYTGGSSIGQCVPAGSEYVIGS